MIAFAAPAKDAASELPPLPPAGRLRLDQQAYGAVREALMSGRLRPGQAITLRGLAEAIGVSRQPAHAALNRLEAEGALVVSPTSGTMRVPSLNRSELDELRDIRVHLEGFAARKAARVVSAAELDEIRQCCDALEREADAGRCSGYAMANWAFHSAVYRSSHSAMLCAAIEPFWLRIGPYVEFMMPDREALMASIPRHREIVEALARGDEDAACEAIIGDITASAAALAQRIDLDEAARPRGGGV